MSFFDLIPIIRIRISSYFLRIQRVYSLKNYATITKYSALFWFQAENTLNIQIKDKSGVLRIPTKCAETSDTKVKQTINIIYIAEPKEADMDRNRKSEAEKSIYKRRHTRRLWMKWIYRFIWFANRKSYSKQIWLSSRRFGRSFR